MKKYLLLVSVLLISATLVACRADGETPSPSPSVTIAPSPTPEKAVGKVTGKVTLQGRTSHEGITVVIGTLSPATTSSDGTFVIEGVAEGEHVIRIERPGYLGAQGQVALSSSGETRTLAGITLLAGDVTADGAVNLFDLVLMGSLYDTEDAASSVADLNGDGKLDVLDLVLVGRNYDQRGPIGMGSQ